MDVGTARRPSRRRHSGVHGQIQALIERKKPSQYARAVELLVELNDIYRRVQEDFEMYWDAVVDVHRRRSAFMACSAKSGLIRTASSGGRRT